MTDIYTYIVDLPSGVHEMVAKCPGGYTVYLRAADSYERQREAYKHALMHIMENDYDKDSVQAIELAAHKEGRHQ